MIKFVSVIGLNSLTIKRFVLQLYMQQGKRVRNHGNQYKQLLGRVPLPSARRAGWRKQRLAKQLAGRRRLITHLSHFHHANFYWSLLGQMEHNPLQLHANRAIEKNWEELRRVGARPTADSKRFNIHTIQNSSVALKSTISCEL